MTDSSDSDLGKNGKDCPKEILAVGSNALLNEAPLEAVENYKSVLDEASLKTFQNLPITQLVLRYALCVALIKCNDYEHIVEAAKDLLNLIDNGYARKLPALYLALARAYYVLNRFKKSLECIEKGVEASFTFKARRYMWPGLQQLIEETARETLLNELRSLQEDCNKAHPPDAVCGFDNCLEDSSHLVPARDIFFTDPGFQPFYLCQCDANCKIYYHLSCWKRLKQINEEVKDFLGAPCLNDSCSSKINSKITQVNLIGSDGFDKPLNTWLLQDHDHFNTRPIHQKIDSSSKIDNDSLSSNGSPVKEFPHPALQIPVRHLPAPCVSPCFTASRNLQPYISPAHSVRGMMFHSSFPRGQRPCFVPVNTRPPVQICPNPGPASLSPAPLPMFWPQPNAYLPTASVQPPANFVEVFVTETSVIPKGSTLIVPVGLGGTVRMKSGTLDCNAVGASEGTVSSQPLGQLPLPAHEEGLAPMKSPVKFSVPDLFRKQVKKLAGENLSKAVSLTSKSASLVTDPNSIPLPVEVGPSNRSAVSAPIKSVVEDFKELVKKLAGEAATNASSAMKESLPCNTPSCPEDVSMRQIVREFRKLVHDLAGSDTSSDCKTGPKTSSGQKQAALEVLDENMNHQEKHNFNACESKADVNSCLLSDIAVSPEVILVRKTQNSMSSTLLDQFMTQPSTFQATSKSSHSKENYNYSEQPLMLSSITSSLCSSQDDIRSEPFDSSKFATLLEILNQCRKVKFGYSDDEYINPELQCFGHPYADFSTYILPDEIDEADKTGADFVFSYYYSTFEKNGFHRLSDVQFAWKDTVSFLLGDNTFTDKYSSVSEFLLKSERFAAIDDVIGTYELLPEMFSKAQVEITESVSDLLFSQAGNACGKVEDFCSNTCNNSWKTITNNNNCDSHAQHSSSAGTDVYGSDDSKEDSDDSKEDFGVDNRLNIVVDAEKFNGGLKPTSEPSLSSDTNVSSKPELVYMSDEDEEIDSGNEVLDFSGNQMGPEPCSEDSNQPVLLDQESQTQETTDKEKENLIKEKEVLFKEVLELKHEKEELHRRIVSLQLQMEDNRTTQESHYSSALREAQEKHEKVLQKKMEELNKNQDQFFAMEQELTQLKEQMEDKDNQVSELNSSLQSIKRSHAKEMNNFVKQLQEKNLQNEEKFKNALISKDERYIKLWKDFCEFKIKKFNQSCNDRLNVLSHLRDMVSDSIHPTKSEIKSMIEKYEEDMIWVTQKNAEVNDVYSQQVEKLRDGLVVSCQLSVVDVPDTMNLPYPPEGAFEYLRSAIKPKQEEFALPQNHFSPTVSKFYPRQITSNGLQSLPPSRESEAFPSAANVSIFGPSYSDPSYRWTSSHPNSSAVSSAMPFDVNNSSISQRTPSQSPFAGPSPLMMQQPSLNLMHPIPYPSTSMQNPSVQSLLGQRSTPSPLPFPLVNGTGFNSSAAASSVLGLKAPVVAAIQKPAPQYRNLPLKNPSPAPPAGVPAVTASQGAIPKPRVQTATASMTPIVLSKAPVRVGVKKPNESNYEKLMRNLQKMFPTRNDAELTQALKITREKNGNTLSSLSHSEIVSKVEEVLNAHFRKLTSTASMGWEKFGQAAWGTTKSSAIEWEGQDQEECCICMTSMNVKEVYVLECRHEFHKECIRKWLELDSVCPNCRKHSTMLDEFPPLG